LDNALGAMVARDAGAALDAALAACGDVVGEE